MDWWTQISTAITGIVFGWALLKQYFPFELNASMEKYAAMAVGFFYPYVQITFQEFSGKHLKSSEAYTFIREYLSENSSKMARRLKADVVKDCQSLVLNMDDYEEVVDVFDGVKVWWTSSKTITQGQSFSFYPRADEIRFYSLTFHGRDREIITKKYIDHVLKHGKAIRVNRRRRKLYVNSSSDAWSGWIHIDFYHPATFDTLAMDDSKKEEIKKDLIKFSEGKEYYAKIGKPWKRGYLLYGPPGTGKSSMIAAMANFLDYDIFDLELTTVNNNTDLKKLLLETSAKSIIVIEDIDCSVDFTGKRSQREEKKEDGDEKEKDLISRKKEEEQNQNSKVTLSGLLNCIDGIWSACGGERIIVFTTNYVDKLDPALIRRGRMDKHIEMSFCSFGAFKILAKNYLDVEWHESFSEIEHLLEAAKITPADVAENLIPKSDDEVPATCLRNLIAALERLCQDAKKAAEEENGAVPVTVNGHC